MSVEDYISQHPEVASEIESIYKTANEEDWCQTCSFRDTILSTGHILRISYEDNWHDSVFVSLSEGDNA